MQALAKKKFLYFKCKHKLMGITYLFYVFFSKIYLLSVIPFFNLIQKLDMQFKFYKINFNYLLLKSPFCVLSK